MSPLSGGTELCQGVTTDDLQGWQSIGLSEVNIGRHKNISLRETPQAQLCVVLYKDPPQNQRCKEDGILMMRSSCMLQPLAGAQTLITMKC